MIKKFTGVILVLAGIGAIAFGFYAGYETRDSGGWGVGGFVVGISMIGAGCAIVKD